MSRGPTTVRDLLRELGLFEPFNMTAEYLPPGLYCVTIAHDDGCPRLSGGTCRCKPEITIERYRRLRAQA